MRIAYVCADPGIPVFGTKGCSIHVQEVVREMRNQGIEVQLFGMRSGRSPLPDFRDLPHHIFEPSWPREGAEREQFALQMNRHLAIALAANGPFDWIYERYSLWSYAGMQYAAAAGIPGILEVNAPLIDEQRLHRQLHDVPAAVNVARRVMSEATAVVCVSRTLQSYVRDCGASPDHIYVVPNGVALARYAPRYAGNAIHVERGPFTIGFVGSLKPWHGMSDLGRAFSLARAVEPQCRLLVIGDGPARDSLTDHLSPEAAASVEFTGEVPHSEIPAQLARMNVGVAPYPQLDNFYFSPLKVMEYMAAGLPVLASRVGDLSSWVTHGRTGYLYPSGDTGALAEGMVTLARSPTRCAQLGNAARRRVAQQNTWQHVVSQITSLANSNVLTAATRSA